MENNFKDEEPTIKIINNNKALQYKVKYNGKNIMKIPAYKQWLEKREIMVLFDTA